MIEDDQGQLVLYADGLLSKYGFNDGNFPPNLGDWLVAQGATFPWNDMTWGNVLVRLVKERLLPVLEERVVVQVLSTVHNPIRAVEIDGEENNWSSPTLLYGQFHPTSVSIPFEDVLETIRTMQREQKEQP